MLPAISLKNASFSMSFDWLLSMIYDLLYDKPNYVRCSSDSYDLLEGCKWHDHRLFFCNVFFTNPVTYGSSVYSYFFRDHTLVCLLSCLKYFLSFCRRLLGLGILRQNSKGNLVNECCYGAHSWGVESWSIKIDYCFRECVDEVVAGKNGLRGRSF